METIGADLESMKRVPLADEHVAAIRAIASECHYAAGQVVAEVGQPTNRFVYVLEGEIEVVDPYTGERLYASGIGATQFIGEIGFLNSGSFYLALRASVPTHTLEVPRTEMLALMSRVPELSDHIIGVFAARRQAQFNNRSSAIKLVGADRDPQVQRIESFLARNRIPFQSYDIDSSEAEASRLCQLVSHEPAVIFARDNVIADPTPRKIAQLLHLDLDVGENPEVDLLIVGGGPAGVAAAVYAGAEGIPALVIEDAAIGGQAGTSSRIENYMGFPTGISGSDLIYRGQIQALKFGSRFAMPRRVSKLERRDDGLFCATIEDNVVCARALLVATGVQYRRLPIDRLVELEGKGVFYAATEMEARFCRKAAVVVIGGGNSAGQAAMYLSRVARHVHVVVRGEGLAESMSAYLSHRLEADPRITIHYRTAVSALEGEDYLSGVTLTGAGDDIRIDTSALFVMIGAAPNTGWLSGLVDLDERGFVKTGVDAGAASPYQTSQPGIYAVGDVRTGSVKRVASAVGEGSVVISAIWGFLEASKV